MKTSNVVVRMEPDIKTKAETILNELGLSASAVINALYHQIIFTKGVPFSMSIPTKIPSIENMLKEEIEKQLNDGIQEPQIREEHSADEVLNRLKNEIDSYGKL